MNMVVVAADRTVVGTAFADVTDLTFTVAANTNYYFRFFLRHWVNATTTGARFALNGPASPTSLKAGCHWGFATATAYSGVVTAYETSFFASTAGLTSATPMPAWIEGLLRNGANAGTFALRFAAEVASPGSATVAADSYGVYEVVG